jgi:hypothetical protein
MNQCACVAMFTSRSAEAMDLFRTTARLSRAAGEEVRGLLADISVNQAHVYAGGAAEVVVDMAPLLRRARETGNPGVQSWAYYVLGEALAKVDQGRAPAAYAACISHGTAVGNRLFVTLARSSAVAVMAAHESPADAVGEFEKVLGEWEDIGNELSQWWVLQNLAIFLARTGDWTVAALLAGAVLGTKDRFIFEREEAGLRRAVESLRSRHGSAEVEALLADGAELHIAAAVAHARAAIRRAS